MTLLALALSALFFCISILHLYWAFGGEWMASRAIPRKRDGMPVFSLSSGSCLFVACVLAGFAYVYLAFADLAPYPYRPKWNAYALVSIAVIFSLRTIGDFRYVGLFKRIKKTDFARSDTLWYTPLCILISISTFLLLVQK